MKQELENTIKLLRDQIPFVDSFQGYCVLMEEIEKYEHILKNLGKTTR